MASTETKRERLEAREARIIKAARKIFLKHGYQGAKMAMIAQEAGVADGTLYLYYKNKNAIVGAVLQHYWQGATDRARQAIAPYKTANERLEVFSQHHLSNLISEWHVAELGYVFRYAGDNSAESTLSLVNDYSQILLDILSRGVDRGEFQADIDPIFIRSFFFGTLEYAARNSIVGIEKSQSKIIKNFTAALMHMVRPKSEPDNDNVDMDTAEHLAQLAQELSAVSTRLDKLIKGRST